MRIPRDPKCLQGKIHNDQISPGDPPTCTRILRCSCTGMRVKSKTVFLHNSRRFRKLTPYARNTGRSITACGIGLHPRSRRHCNPYSFSIFRRRPSARRSRLPEAEVCHLTSTREPFDSRGRRLHPCTRRTTLSTTKRIRYTAYRLCVIYVCTDKFR
jgi:hypothetical protein